MNEFSSAVEPSADGCPWGRKPDVYRTYHDQEWGMPVWDDRHLFEMIMLEGAQAGLSWLTILRRREGYRAAFDQFDPHILASYSPEKLEELRQDERIIRNRLKIESAIRNARGFLRIQEKHGSFAAWLWDFVDGIPLQNQWLAMSDVPVSTALSDRISKELRSGYGFNFVGSVILYSFLQAVGVVNDHLVSCPRHAACARAAEKARKPLAALRKNR